MRRTIAMLAALAAGLVLSSVGASAQSGWTDRGPVFESDLKQKSEQEEAARAERRKSYGPTVYPKFMQGGERPEIKPVALSQTSTSTMTFWPLIIEPKRASSSVATSCGVAVAAVQIFTSLRRLR